jgi:hypothetical protein
MAVCAGEHDWAFVHRQAAPERPLLPRTAHGVETGDLADERSPHVPRTAESGRAHR